MYVWWPCRNGQCDHPNSTARANNKNHQRRPHCTPGPICRTIYGMFLIAIDAWLFILPMTRITAEETIEKLRQLMETHGSRKQLLQTTATHLLAQSFGNMKKERRGANQHCSPTTWPKEPCRYSKSIRSNGRRQGRRTVTTSQISSVFVFLPSHNNCMESRRVSYYSHYVGRVCDRSWTFCMHPDLSQTVRTRQGAKKEAHDRSCRERLNVGQQALVWYNNMTLKRYRARRNRIVHVNIKRDVP